MEDETETQYVKDTIVDSPLWYFSQALSAIFSCREMGAFWLNHNFLGDFSVEIFEETAFVQFGEALAQIQVCASRHTHSR